MTHTRQLILTLTMAIVAVAQPARNVAYAFYDNESSLRLQIIPRETEVSSTDIWRAESMTSTAGFSGFMSSPVSTS